MIYNEHHIKHHFDENFDLNKPLGATCTLRRTLNSN